MEMLSNRNKDSLIKNGRENTYREYMMGASHFGGAGGQGQANPFPGKDFDRF